MKKMLLMIVSFIIFAFASDSGYDELFSVSKVAPKEKIVSDTTYHILKKMNKTYILRAITINSVKLDTIEIK